MSFRSIRAAALLSSLVLAACGDGSGLLGVAGGSNVATMRFVNVSGSALDVAVNGSVSGSNANIASGSALACVQVTAPGSELSVRKSGTTTNLVGFAPTFSSDGRYTMIAYPDASGAALFASIPNAFLPVTGNAALRVFNGVAAFTTVDVYVTPPGSPFGTPRETGVAFGRASASFSVLAGSSQVRLISAGPVISDVGTYVLDAGKSYTLVVSPGPTALLVPDC
jgi:hypothetical protein